MLLFVVDLLLVVVHLPTSGFVPVRSDDTPKVKLQNCPGTISTTEIARAGATKVEEPSYPTILSPTASVIFRIL